MFKKIGVGLAIAAIVAAVGVGAVLAQEPTPTDETPSGGSPPAEAPGPGGPCGGRGMRGGPHDGPLEVVAEALGMTVEELRTALADGQTIVELAEAEDVALDDIADAMVTAHAERLQQAVESGRLTQEEADEKLAEMEANMLEHLKSGEFGGPGGPGGPDMPGGPRGGHFGGGAPFDVLAEALGMTADELRDALADGQTIADLAEAKGVALKDVAAALVTAQTERSQQMVENGRLTQEEADAKLAEMEANILERLESGEFVGPFGPGGPDMPGGPRGGHLGGASFDVLAEALGMTVDELRDALADGQTIADLAEAKGVALKDVAAALVAAHAEHLQQAVESGRLTQEEADEKLAEMEANILEHLETGEFVGPGGPGGPGGFGGHGGMGGGPRGGGFHGPRNPDGEAPVPEE